VSSALLGPFWYNNLSTYINQSGSCVFCWCLEYDDAI
jgi:hypothetical protein